MFALTPEGALLHYGCFQVLLLLLLLLMLLLMMLLLLLLLLSHVEPHSAQSGARGGGCRRVTRRRSNVPSSATWLGRVKATAQTLRFLFCLFIALECSWQKTAVVFDTQRGIEAPSPRVGAGWFRLTKAQSK